MAVNYETLSFAPPPDETTAATKPRASRPQGPKHQIIALAFSTRGPISAAEWKPMAANVTLALQDELGLRRQLSKIPSRFLDATNLSTPSQLPEGPSPDPPNPVRILELTIPLPKAKTLPDPAACAKITRSPPLQDICLRNYVELVLQPHSLYTSHRVPGLAVFDMDSTLIQQEVIDELARAVGRYDAVAAITDAAMRGEAPYTDFTASLQARVGLLQGVPSTIWTQLKKEVITFTPGARELVRVLKKLGWKTAVLSGGFTPLANWVKEELGLDYAFANHLVEENGHLTGQLVEGKEIVNAERKRILLEEIAEKEGVELGMTVAVGDGSNDLLMMHKAGLGVAFNAKPKVQIQAPARLNAEGLLDVVYLLGYTTMEVMEVLKEEMVWEGGQYVLRRLVPLTEGLPGA